MTDIAYLVAEPAEAEPAEVKVAIADPLRIVPVTARTNQLLMVRIFRHWKSFFLLHLQHCSLYTEVQETSQVDDDGGDGLAENALDGRTGQSSIIEEALRQIHDDDTELPHQLLQSPRKAANAEHSSEHQLVDELQLVQTHQGTSTYIKTSVPRNFKSIFLFQPQCHWENISNNLMVGTLSAEAKKIFSTLI